MTSSRRKDTFKHPSVFGVICKSSRDGNAKALQKKFTRAFKKARLPFVYLTLKVEPKHLKNLILCMKLMDVRGVNIPEAYDKKVIPLLDRLDKSAKLAKKVNVIYMSGKKFVGHYVGDILAGSLRLWNKF